jgi:hypothetical protein
LLTPHHQPKETEERLSRNLKAEGRDEKLNEIIANEGASRIGKDTLIIVDPTDIRKEYAGKMPYLATIHDGSSGKISTGYSGCMAVACEPRRRKAEDLPSIQPCAYHSSQEKDVL